MVKGTRNDQSQTKGTPCITCPLLFSFVHFSPDLSLAFLKWLYPSRVNPEKMLRRPSQSLLLAVLQDSEYDYLSNNEKQNRKFLSILAGNSLAAWKVELWGSVPSRNHLEVIYGPRWRQSSPHSPTSPPPLCWKREG